MKVLLSRLGGVWHGTVRVVKRSKKAESVRATEKNSTTSDTIGLAVLIMSLLVLSHAMPIEYGNQNENDV